MDGSYYTIGEIATKWNVSPRHIQYLCKQGRITGATKKAGVWFIPGDATIPIKNNKADAVDFEFIGTKKKIFSSAITLFMRHGYENVSIREIADAVGITQSAMYNHFKSKREILDVVYNYFCHYYLLDRPSLGDIEQILRNGTLLDILKSLCYEFKSDYQQNIKEITKILFQRVAIDERARELMKSLMIDEGISFVEMVFERAVEIGRIAPLDTHAMAVFINGIRVFMLFNWIIDDSADFMRKIAKDENTIYENVVRLLTDLKPVTKETPAVI